MPQSLSKLFVHIIFRIKNGSVEIDKSVRNELYAYMGAIIKDNESISMDRLIINLPFQGAITNNISFTPRRCHRAELTSGFQPF
jgi:hypothetical protein